MSTTAVIPESEELINEAISSMLDAWERADGTMTDRDIKEASDVFYTESVRCLKFPVHLRQVLTSLTHRVISRLHQTDTDTSKFAVDLSSIDDELEARGYAIVQFWVRAISSGDPERAYEVFSMTFIAVTGDQGLMPYLLRSFIDFICALDIYIDEMADDEDS